MFDLDCFFTHLNVLIVNSNVRSSIVLYYSPAISFQSDHGDPVVLSTHPDLAPIIDVYHRIARGVQEESELISNNRRKYADGVFSYDSKTGIITIRACSLKFVVIVEIRRGSFRSWYAYFNCDYVLASFLFYQVEDVPLEISAVLLRKSCRCAACIDESSGESLLKPDAISEQVHPIEVFDMHYNMCI